MSKIEEIKRQIEEMKAKRGEQVAQPTMSNINTFIPSIERHIPVTENQVKTYFNLCQQKGQQIDVNYRRWDGKRFGQMDKEIQRLLKLPTVKRPTENQIQMLTEICERNGWDVPDYSDKTGGREGTMSALIGELIELEKETRRLAPPTEEQIESILEMYYCPDVEMADLNESFGVTYNKDTNQKIWWTRPSQEEIKKVLPDLITYQMASEFIFKYQLPYYSWKKTRLSDGQKERIKRIQEKCGMQPMEDYQLMQFDRATADLYIRSTELVMADRDLVKFPKEIEHDSKEGRGIKDIAELEKDLIVKKENVIHALYAMMGMLAKDDSDILDATHNDDMIKDLAGVVEEICGTQAVFEILLEAYTEQEVCSILNITEEKYTKEELEIMEIVSTITSTTIEEEREYLMKTCQKLLEQYHNDKLVSDEVYEETKVLFA